MNRQTKRLMAKQEKAKAAGSGRGSGGRKPPPPQAAAKKKRTGARQFLREVRQELKKVQWPTRKELISYSVVVLVTVVVLTSFVFVLDLLFSKAATQLFGG